MRVSKSLENGQAHQAHNAHARHEVGFANATSAQASGTHRTPEFAVPPRARRSNDDKFRGSNLMLNLRGPDVLRAKLTRQLFISTNASSVAVPRHTATRGPSGLKWIAPRLARIL
jgi:hypothetical protein|tara:strand:- start:3430 stop:3774 length:345 start_codon:yes stop_codon:yes gene_type:complete